MRNAFTWASVHLPQQKLRATGPHSWVPHTLPDCFCWDLLTVSAFQQQSWTQEGDAGQIIHWQFAGKKTLSIPNFAVSHQLIENQHSYLEIRILKGTHHWENRNCCE